jgi:anti-sigma-K factor RskA
MATLDALGLLSEGEQQEYEQAFRAASPEVRRQIRAEQRRSAEFEASLLPRVEPDAALRARVVGAVVQAGALEESSGVRAVVHRPGRVVPKVRPSRRVSPLWRAASIGLAIAVTVLSVLSVQFLEHNTRLREAMAVSELFDKVGTRQVRDTLFDPNTRRIILTATAGAPAGFKTEAVLLVNPDWKQARFFCSSLAGTDGKPEAFELCLVDENQRVVRTLNRFQSDEGRWISFDIPATSLNQGRLALVASATQTVVMIAKG